MNIWHGTAAGGQPALVAGKQIFATHYLNGSLNVVTVLSGTAGPPNYLVTLNRSIGDILGGVLGGFARRIIERRLRSEAAAILHGLRQRLESELPCNTVETARDLPVSMNTRWDKSDTNSCEEHEES